MSPDKTAGVMRASASHIVKMHLSIDSVICEISAPLIVHAWICLMLQADDAIYVLGLLLPFEQDNADVSGLIPVGPDDTYEVWA